MSQNRPVGAGSSPDSSRPSGEECSPAPVGAAGFDSKFLSWGTQLRQISKAAATPGSKASRVQHTRAGFKLVLQYDLITVDEDTQREERSPRLTVGHAREGQFKGRHPFTAPVQSCYGFVAAVSRAAQEVVFVSRDNRTVRVVAYREADASVSWEATEASPVIGVAWDHGPAPAIHTADGTVKFPTPRAGSNTLPFAQRLDLREPVLACAWYEGVFLACLTKSDLFIYQCVDPKAKDKKDYGKEMILKVQQALPSRRQRADGTPARGLEVDWWAHKGGITWSERGGLVLLPVAFDSMATARVSLKSRRGVQKLNFTAETTQALTRDVVVTVEWLRYRSFRDQIVDGVVDDKGWAVLLSSYPSRMYFWHVHSDRVPLVYTLSKTVEGQMHSIALLEAKGDSARIEASGISGLLTVSCQQAYRCATALLQRMCKAQQPAGSPALPPQQLLQQQLPGKQKGRAAAAKAKAAETPRPRPAGGRGAGAAGKDKDKDKQASDACEAALRPEPKALRTAGNGSAHTPAHAAASAERPGADAPPSAKGPKGAGGGVGGCAAPSPHRGRGAAAADLTHEPGSAACAAGQRDVEICGGSEGVQGSRHPEAPAGGKKRGRSGSPPRGAKKRECPPNPAGGGGVGASAAPAATGCGHPAQALRVAAHPDFELLNRLERTVAASDAAVAFERSASQRSYGKKDPPAAPPGGGGDAAAHPPRALVVEIDDDDARISISPNPEDLSSRVGAHPPGGLDVELVCGGTRVSVSAPEWQGQPVVLPGVDVAWSSAARQGTPVAAAVGAELVVFRPSDGAVLLESTLAGAIRAVQTDNRMRAVAVTDSSVVCVSAATAELLWRAPALPAGCPKPSGIRMTDTGCLVSFPGAPAMATCARNGYSWTRLHGPRELLAFAKLESSKEFAVQAWNQMRRARSETACIHSMLDILLSRSSAAHNVL
ncbi:hypothetical protein DIPPA_09659 [Diplonema papillatum]|nr:hypothetical protein DIPPA_09659 [Diplonema papillatum]